MCLVVVEQAKTLIGMIPALALREGVGHPAEETFEKLLSEQYLDAPDAAGSILGQCLSDWRGRVFTARNEAVKFLVESDGFQGQGRTQLEREPGGQVQGAGSDDRRIAEHRGHVLWAGRLSVDARAASQCEFRNRPPGDLQAGIGQVA